MYTLTKIKTFNGREGQGLNATICKDGKPVCYVLDDASGGEVEFDYRNPGQTRASFEATTREAAQTAERELGEFCLAAIPAKERAEIEASAAKAKATYAPELKVEMRVRADAINHWVNSLVDAHSNKKRLDRVAKTKTLFRVEGDSTDSYRTIKRPYDAAVQGYLDREYPGKVVEIWGVLPARAA